MKHISTASLLLSYIFSLLVGIFSVIIFYIGSLIMFPGLIEQFKAYDESSGISILILLAAWLSQGFILRDLIKDEFESLNKEQKEQT